MTRDGYRYGFIGITDNAYRFGTLTVLYNTVLFAIFRCTHKRQYFIDPFLIRCVRCKHDHV